MRTAILALLAEQPMNGYQAIQTLEERTDGLWKPSPGAVYPALSQLADEGLVRQLDQDGRPVYELTKAGREAAAAITDKPWETVTEASSGWLPEGTHALWQEFGQLAVAARSALATGDSGVVDQAVQALKDARRRVYGLLAGGPDDSEA